MIFTVNIHTDKISINIFIYFIYYTGWNKFFIKIHVKALYIQIWFKCETHILFFLPWSRKKVFFVDYEKVIELYVVHMTSLAIWVDEVTGVMISIKKINKN